MSDEAEDSEVRDEGEGGEADVNAGRYLEYCRRMGVRPKFSGNWQKANDPQGQLHPRQELLEAAHRPQDVRAQT